MAAPAKRRKISADGQTNTGRSGSTGPHPLRQMSLPIEGDTSEGDGARESMSPADPSPPVRPAANGAHDGGEENEDTDDDENREGMDAPPERAPARPTPNPSGYDGKLINM